MENKNLPKEWEWLKLREVGKIISGGTPSTRMPEYWNGNINWISPADLTGYKKKVISKGAKSITEMGLKKSSAHLMPKGSVLFSSRAPIGYVAIAGEELSTNQGFKSIVPNEEVLSDFLYYFLKASKQKAENAASGTTFKEISLAKFSELEIPLPPKPTQQAIVSKIEELFSEIEKGIESLSAAKLQLKTYRQSVLKWAFEGKLTNENVKEGELPEGWKWVKLGDVIEKPKYGTSKKCLYNVNGKGVLRIPNIVKGIVDSEDLKYADFDKEEIETYSLKEGDILTIRSNGSVDIVGKCALITKKDEEFLYAGYLIRLRPVQSKILPKYLINILSSVSLRNQIEGKAKSTSGVNNINSEELSGLMISLPSNIEDQHQIVQEIESRLSVADRMEESINESLQQAEALKQSILKKAFEGRLI